MSVKNNTLCFVLTVSLFIGTHLSGIECTDFGAFKQYNGHYYAISGNKLTFAQAKQIAENNNGYLAIPNDAGENNFLATTFGTGWIGIYDPSFTQTNLCYYGNTCSISSIRFKTVKGLALSYQNWAVGEPSNSVFQYDILDGKNLVAPLGEHWVVIGQNGQWGDFGNHAADNNNPVQFKAIMEFETKPECANDGNTTDPTMDRKCTESAYNTGTTSSGTVTTDSNGEATITASNTYTCQTDLNGNEYCPAQLAPCASSWGYDNGYSQEKLKCPDDSAPVGGICPSNIKACPDGSVSEGTKCVGHSSYTATSVMSCPAKIYYRPIDEPNENSTDPSEWSWFANSPLTLKTETTTSCTYEGPYVPKSSIQIRAVSPKTSVGGCPTLYLRNGGIGAWNLSATYQYITPLVGTSGAVFASSYGNGTNKVCFSDIGRAVNDFYYVTPLYVNSSCPSGGTLSGTTCNIDINVDSSCPTTYPNIGIDGFCFANPSKYYGYYCPSTVNEYGQTYTITNPGGTTTTDPIPPINNCKIGSFTCVAATDRKCAFVSNQWQCSPFPCFGESNLESADTTMGETDSANKGFNTDGSCSYQIRLFNGKDMRCRSWDLLFGLLGGGCCQKEKPGGLGGLFGSQCNESEKLLSKYRKETSDKSVEIGQYCSKYLKLGFAKICVQKKKTYCVFNSKLARIIHEQGRPQIGIEWGAPKAPNCKGFTPEEFQKIDFSKLDLSEFYGDLQSKIQTTIDAKIGTTIQQKVQSFGVNIGGGN